MKEPGQPVSDDAAARVTPSSFARTVLDSMRDAISIIDVRDLRIAGVNKAFLDEYGLTEGEVIGRKCHEITHGTVEPCGLPNHVCPLKEILERKEARMVEHVHYMSDGQKHFVEVAAFPIINEAGSVTQVVHTSRDITDRKMAEIRLKASRDELHKRHEQLTTLFRQVEQAKIEWERTMDCVGDMILIVDKSGMIKRCNNAVRRFTETGFDDIIGREWDEFLARYGMLPTTFFVSETELYHEASKRWFIFNSYPFRGDGESMDSGTVITIHDATQIRTIAEELEKKNFEIDESRTKLQHALDEITSLIERVSTAQDFGIRYENPHISRCYEMKNCDKTNCQCYGADAVRCWQTAGTYCGGQIQGKFAAKYRNCVECDVYTTATADPIYRIGEQFNNMMHILDTKNSELNDAYKKLKATQAQFLQQEKMASIGQLAAGVAHEINNPMGFIGSNLGSLDKYVDKFTEFIKIQSDALEKTASPEELETLRQTRNKLKIDYITDDIKELVKESLDGADRVKKIVQDLKSFSRVDEAEYKPADINECIESTINIVRNEIKYKAKVVKEYGEIPMTKCFPQQINQVFMNLLVNAAHAIEKEGVITVRTWLDGESIFASVTDTGSGIPPETVNRIFEPFYTTKPVGKGTGLGLSITFDIIKKHNGEITVDSEVGKGTTFTIRIPVVGGK